MDDIVEAYDDCEVGCSDVDDSSRRNPDQPGKPEISFAPSPSRDRSQKSSGEPIKSRSHSGRGSVVKETLITRNFGAHNLSMSCSSNGKHRQYQRLPCQGNFGNSSELSSYRMGRKLMPGKSFASRQKQSSVRFFIDMPKL